MEPRRTAAHDDLDRPAQPFRGDGEPTRDPQSTGRPDPLFARYPSCATRTLSNGAEVPLPFHGYDIEAMSLHGTVDGGTARRLFDGTDHQPVGTEDGRGFASLWLIDYRDTCVGPYREVSLSIPVATEAKPVPWVNDFSVLAPALTGAPTYVVRLLLPAEAQVPILYGRELLSLDKRPASRITVQRDGRIHRFQAEEGGTVALRVEVEEDDRLLAKVDAVLKIGANIGIAALLKVLATPIHTTDCISRIGNDSVQTTRSHVTSSSTLTRVTADVLEANPATDYGALLCSLAFKPFVAQCDTRARMVVEALS